MEKEKSILDLLKETIEDEKKKGHGLLKFEAHLEFGYGLLNKKSIDFDFDNPL